MLKGEEEVATELRDVTLTVVAWSANCVGETSELSEDTEDEEDYEKDINEWKRLEYEQVSDDFRHNVVMGWQSFIAMIAADGVLLAVIPNSQNGWLGIFVLIVASFSTFMIAWASWKWTRRNHTFI